MLWNIVIPIGVTLIFDALVVVLFSLGMFFGMRNQEAPYTERIAKGWVRGWLFVIALMLPWLVLLALLLIGFEYAGNPEAVYYMFFGGITIVLVYPGVDITLWTRSVYSSMRWKPIVQIALGWTVPFAIFWATGFWVWFTQYHAIYKLTKSQGLNLSRGHYFGLVALVILISLAASRALGIKVMSKQLIVPPKGIASADLVGHVSAGPRIVHNLGDLGRFFTFSVVRDRYFSGLRLATLKLWAIKRLKMLQVKIERPLSSFARAKTGWGVAWALFIWLAAQRFEVHGLSDVELWLYNFRFVFITAPLVSIGAGLIATLLMRDPTTSWGQTFILAKTWITIGLLGWFVGTPLGWGAVWLYQWFIVFLLRNSAIKLANKINISQQTSFMIVGFFALIAAYFAIQKKINLSK